MDKPMLYAIIGGLVGAVVALLVSSYSVNNRNYQMMGMMGMGSGVRHMIGVDAGSMGTMMGHDEGMTMDGMVSTLISLRGDEFDRTFIEMMIEHHQGAIDMANLIPSRTNRDEIKNMGEDIVSVQSREIEMMQGWLSDWFGE